MNELISVILPIYNVDKYLKQCLDSIIKQTYKNLEIILVNDGSTDKCGEICDEYAKNDTRIKVIHKENGGVSSARNEGLKAVTGEYIAFIDPDDFVAPVFIERLYLLMKENRCDIIQCDFFRYLSDEKIESYEIDDEIEIVSNYEFQRRLCMYEDINFVVLWNKLYKKKLFDNIIFPFGKINEDEAMIHHICHACKTNAIITNDKLYYYRTAPNSIMKKKYNISRLDIIDAMEDRLSFYRENNEQELYNLTLIKYHDILKTNYYLAKKYLNNSNKYIRIIKEKLRKYYKEYMNLDDVSKVDKIKYAILSNYSFVYCILFYLIVHKNI